MKLLVLSDLHIEFLPDGYRLPPIAADFDAVVLAGDIYRPLRRSLEWIARERDGGAFKGRPVIFVPGNHEFYRSQVAREMPEAVELARTLGISLPAGSVADRYAGQALTAAFASDLSEVILKHQPELWIHGHDHGSHDYLVGRTRILANQAGYPTHFGTRENPNFNPCLVVQV